MTRTATGRDAPFSGGGADESGDFREFHSDEQGRVIDSDGNPVAPPENGWVEHHGEGSSGDDRVRRPLLRRRLGRDQRSSDGDAPTTPEPPVFPFAYIKDSEWRETVRWEDEDDADDAAALFVESGPAAGPGPNFFARSSGMLASRARQGALPTKTQKTHHASTTRPRRRRRPSGFASGLDAERPEAVARGTSGGTARGVGRVMEEIPRVRELLDELGGHDVPVLPVPQAYLGAPTIDALQIQEPDWDPCTSRRGDDT